MAESRKKDSNSTSVQVEKADIITNTRQSINYLSSGITLLNMACSDKAIGAFRPGTMTNLIGDSSSGKSMIALSILAEACSSPAFDKYKKIYDDAEAALFFDIEKLFGSKLAEQIDFPNGIDEEGAPTKSNSVEELDLYLNRLLEAGTPFIYIVDSLDSLPSIHDIEYAEETRSAVEKGKPLPGSYEMQKAKALSKMFRELVKKLEKSNSILIVLSQVRDNPNQIGYIKKPYRTGGKALKFYSSLEIWLNVKGTIDKQVKGQKHKIGQWVKANVTKNKYTGKYRTVEFPIYYSYGVDDIESLLYFLASYDVAKLKGSKIDVTINEKEYRGPVEKIVREIENDGTYQALRKMALSTWKDIEQALITDRKPKYI